MVLCLLRKGNFSIVGRTLLFIDHLRGNIVLRYILPRSRQVWKICCTCASAWLRASSGVSLPRGGLAHQLPDEPAVEDLRNRRIRIPWIANIGGPVPGVRQHLVLVGRRRLGVMGEERLHIWHRVRETRHIVKPTGQEAVPELPHIVHQELLGAVDILGELPDEIALDASSPA